MRTVLFVLALSLSMPWNMSLAEDTDMRTVIVPSFYVIGKEGQGRAGDKQWILPLWAAAGGGFGEIESHIRRNARGGPAGVWGMMSDVAGTFMPWDDSGGKYLAGFEARDDSPPPAGWTKWRVPGYRYAVVRTTIAEYQKVFENTLAQVLQESGRPLAGAVHEHYPVPDDPNIVELFFPIERVPGENVTARGRLVMELEGRLRAAMMDSDVNELDKLLADDLVFVAHNGQKVGKGDDLKAHRQKLFSIGRLDFLEQELRDLGSVFVTVTATKVEGDWGGAPFEEAITYMRVWRDPGDGQWQVVAGQATKSLQE